MPKDKRKSVFKKVIKETEYGRRARIRREIMSIEDPLIRQREIRKNMDVFCDYFGVIGKK